MSDLIQLHSCVKISEQIISTASVALRGAELVAEYGGKGTFEHMLPMIGWNNTKVIETKK